MCQQDVTDMCEIIKIMMTWMCHQDVRHGAPLLKIMMTWFYYYYSS